MTLCALCLLILPYVFVIVGGFFTVSGTLLIFLNQAPKVPSYHWKIPGPVLLFSGIILLCIGGCLWFRRRMRNRKYTTRKSLINAAATETEKKKRSTRKRAQKRKMPTNSIGGRPVERPVTEGDIEMTLADRIKQRRLEIQSESPDNLSDSKNSEHLCNLE